MYLCVYSSCVCKKIVNVNDSLYVVLNKCSDFTCYMLVVDMMIIVA